MKTLTVFTPTYNRAYCLHQLYDSLVQQTSQDFCWLIIDDGSTDNTKNLVQGWVEEDRISIQYHYQENQGMHGGHNTAYSLIATPLNVCIDSDDFMPGNAVELILFKWEDIRHREDIAGIVALDGDKKGNIIGSKMPEYIQFTKLSGLYHQYNVTGDKKLIYRTEIVKKFPKYPLFEGERFVPLGSLYLMIDQDYNLAILNEIVCTVEYLPDGSSLNIFKQYRRHPKGFHYSRQIGIKYGASFKQKFKNAVHLVSSNIQLKRLNLTQGTSNLPITVLAIPFGLFLYFYIRIKVPTLD